MTDLVPEPDIKFNVYFLCMPASIQGWPHCRPVISVDATFLKNKYRGMMMIASTLDGDNKIFPLAFAIVDSENNASWLWFMTKLREAIGSRDRLVIVSDRHDIIPPAIVRQIQGFWKC